MIDTLIIKFEKYVPGKLCRRILLHFLFWAIWLSRNLYDTVNAWGMESSLYLVLVVFITQVPMVYLHLYLLVPRFLNQRKYLLHIFFTLLLIVVYSWCNYSLLKILPSENLSSGMNSFLRTLKPNYDFLEGFIVVILTYSLKYMLIAFITQNELLKLQKEKLQLELRALKAQINPHFFFNTLNNLYSLTLKNSSQSSEVVLKLSDMMRYVLYECNEDKVLLSKEINFLKNYIELERLRFNESYSISFKQTGEAAELMVAPMILIEFVENSFKHGLSRQYSAGWVEIEVHIDNNKLSFTTINSKGHVDEEKENQKSGIGLINVKKRLELIYPEQFILEINDSTDLYKAHLEIPLQT